MRLRFAEHHRLPAGGRDQRGQSRPVPGGLASFGRERNVWVGAEKQGTILQRVGRLGQFLPGQLRIDSHHDRPGTFRGWKDLEPGRFKGLDQPLLADGEHARSGRKLGSQVGRRPNRAGEHLLGMDRHPKGGELGHHSLRGLAGVVGRQDESKLSVAEQAEEFLQAEQGSLPSPEDSVHVDYPPLQVS